MSSFITLNVIVPEICITVLALIILLFGLVERLRGAILPVSLLGILGILIYTLLSWGAWGTGFSNMVIRDALSVTFEAIFLTAAFLAVLVSGFFFSRIRNKGEYISLLLLAAFGMMVMAIAGDMIVIFLGLETMSIALYILVGFKRSSEFSIEAALKYFLLGAFATGFLLYGMAFVYGAAGTTNLRAIISVFQSGAGPGGPFMYIGLGLVLVGLGFKVALVPFHMWTPDVYDGAPTPVTAFMSAGAKGAGFAAILRIFTEAAGPLSDSWTGLLWVLAALTMTVGNVAALTQSNIKRMLAYSSIAHAGYILMGVLAGTQSAYAAILFYILAYTFMKVGAFAIVEYLESSDKEMTDISGYAGMGFKKPWAAIAMTVFMLSLSGFPPTAGFIGKFFVFRSAIEAGFVGLTVIAVLNSLVSVYYYIGIVVIMYMKEPVTDFSLIPKKPMVALGFSIACIALIVFGVLPDRIMTVLIAAF